MRNFTGKSTQPHLSRRISTMRDGRCLCALCILAIKLVWLPAACCSSTMATSDAHRRNLPHITHMLENTFFLAADTAWKPNLNTLLVALMANVPLMLDLNSSIQHASNETLLAYLKYRCLPNETDYQLIVLTPANATAPSIYCPNNRPFRFERLIGEKHRFNITLTDQTGYRIDFDQVMTHYLEFRVYVEFYEGETESGSLFVFNVDSLISLSSNSPTASHGLVFRKYILTDEAIAFMVSLRNTRLEPVFSVPFLTTNFTDALKKASLIIRSSLAISLLIRGNKTCSDRIDHSAGDVIFSSGDSDQSINWQVVTRYLGYIDPFNGILVVSEKELEMARSYLRARFTSTPISACLLISLNWPAWNYRLIATISDQLSTSAFPTRWSPPKYGCEVKGTSGGYVWLTLLMGMQDVVLPNRLMCSSLVNDVPTVDYENKYCVNNAVGIRGKWQRCDLYSVYETGNYIRLEEGVQLGHSGRYRFWNRGKHFTYYITVVTLPLFNATFHAGALATKTYANLDTRVSFNCTLHHDGWKHIRLRPVFRIYRMFEKTKWKDLTLDEFTTKVLKQRPGSVKKRIQMSQPSLISTYIRRHSTSLIIELPHVTMKWRNWLLIFYCNATVASSDARIMGLQHYSIQSGTNVEFSGIRLKTEQNLATKGIASELGSLMGSVCVHFIVALFNT